MGLPCGIWPVILGLIWLAKGGQGDTFYNPLGNAAGVTRSHGGGDDILNINKDLIPQEAPESSFLMEGDIVKTSHSRALSVVSPRWVKRKGVVRIPYILSHVYDAASMAVIQEAFADFAHFTCVKFVPRSYQKDFISIMPVAGCFSSVGRAGGMQVVSLDPACLQRGKGVALHELMHVVGFWHEHSRADRDKYIKISWNDILTGFEVNFMKSWTTNMLVGYDYSSILHYGRYAFSRTGWPTITPLADPHMALGQRHYLSHSDIARVNRLYKCHQMGVELETSTAHALLETTAVSRQGDLDSCLTEGESKIEASSPGTHRVGTARQAASNCPRTGTAVPSARTTLEGEEPGVSQSPAGSFPLTTLPSEGHVKSVEPIGQVTTEMGVSDASTDQRLERESLSETPLLSGTEALEQLGPTESSSLEGKTHPEVMSHYVEVSGKLDTTRSHTKTPPGELGLLELTSPGLATAEIGGAWLRTMGRRDVSPFLGSMVHLLSNLPSLPIPAWTSSPKPGYDLEPPTELAAAESTAPLGEGEGEKWTTSLASNKPTTALAKSALYQKNNSWMASTQETLEVPAQHPWTSHPHEMRTTPKGHGQDTAASGRLEMAMPVSSQATALVFSESWAANPTAVGVEGAIALQEKGPSLLSGSPNYLQVGVSKTRAELGLVETTKSSMHHHTSPIQPGVFSPGTNVEASVPFPDSATSPVAQLSQASDSTEMRVQDSVSNPGNKTGLTLSVPLPIGRWSPTYTLLSPGGSKSPKTALHVGTAESASSAVQLAVSSASRWHELKEKKAGFLRWKKRERMYTLTSLLAPSTATPAREPPAWRAPVVQAAHPGELGTEASLPEQKRLQNISRPASATEQTTSVKVLLSLESSANVLEWGMEANEGITRMRSGQATPSEPVPKTELGPVIRTFVPRVLEKWTLVCEEQASSQVPTTNTQAPVTTVKKPFVDTRPCYGGPPAKQTLPLFLAPLPQAPGLQEPRTKTTESPSPRAWSRPGGGYGHGPVAMGAVGLHGDAMEKASPETLAGYAEVVAAAAAAATTTLRQVDVGETPSFLVALTETAKMETTVTSVLPLEALVAQHRLAPVFLALPHGSSMLAEGSSRPSAKTAKTVNGAARRAKKTWSTAFAGAEAQRPIGWPWLSRTSMAEPCPAVPKEQTQNSPKDVLTPQSDPRKKGCFHAPTPQAWPPQGVWHSQSTAASTASRGFPFWLMTSARESWSAGSSVVGLGPLVPRSPGHGSLVSHGGPRRGLPSTEQHQTPLETRSLTATPSLANKWLTLQALTDTRRATPSPPGSAPPTLGTEGAHAPMLQEQSSAGAPGGSVVLHSGARKPLLTPWGRLTTLAPAGHSDTTALSTAPAPLWPSTAAPAGGMSLAASLPWHRPGPANAMPSIPQGGATPGLPPWQGCNFEQGLCGWWQSVDDDLDWVLARQSPSAGTSDHGGSDPSCSPSWGGFLSLKAPSIHWAPGKMAAVISPTFHGIGCIFFWYRRMGSGMSTINVYLHYEGSPAWHRIWSAKGQQGTGWHRMTMETFRMQRLQVVLEGVLGPDAGSELHIDNVAICGALCWASCARQLQPCTSPNY